MFTKTDYKYFAKAKQVASISDYHKTHIGCVAVYQGQIIGIGCNCNKTHPTQKYYNRYRKPSEDLLQEMCEKPTPLGVGWIAQNEKVYVDIENIHIL